MRAVRCCEGGVSLVDVPREPGEGVRVRIRSAGICGSDLHIVSGGFPVPHTLGHEFAGELDDGRLVAVEPLTPCGECDFCLERRFNLCRSGTGNLLGVGQDGGMTDEIWVAERSLVPLRGAANASNGCLVEPLAVVVHGLREGGVGPGQRIAVVGGGTIGLCTVAAAASMGAEVGLVARHKHQIEAGRRLAAVETLGGDYPVVVDCAGTKESLAQAASLCRPGGVLLLIASYWDGLVLPGFLITLREIRVVPSSLYDHRHDTSDFTLAAEILAGNSEIAATLITHRLPLDDAVRAFELAADRRAGAIKIVLEA